MAYFQKSWLICGGFWARQEQLKLSEWVMLKLDFEYCWTLSKVLQNYQFIHLSKQHETHFHCQLKMWECNFLTSEAIFFNNCQISIAFNCPTLQAVMLQHLIVNGSQCRLTTNGTHQSPPTHSPPRVGTELPGQ